MSGNCPLKGPRRVPGGRLAPDKIAQDNMRYAHWATVGLMAIGLWASALAAEFVVRDIRVEGLRRISAGTVFNYLPVKVGDTFDERDAGDAIRALFKAGFFKDVQIQREGDVLVVQVVERPSIDTITFNGNENLKSEIGRAHV